jgi:hypothetical protein
VLVKTEAKKPELLLKISPAMSFYWSNLETQFKKLIIDLANDTERAIRTGLSLLTENTY